MWVYDFDFSFFRSSFSCVSQRAHTFVVNLCLCEWECASGLGKQCWPQCEWPSGWAVNDSVSTESARTGGASHAVRVGKAPTKKQKSEQEVA